MMTDSRDLAMRLEAAKARVLASDAACVKTAEATRRAEQRAWEMEGLIRKGVVNGFARVVAGRAKDRALDAETAAFDEARAAQAEWMAVKAEAEAYFAQVRPLYAALREAGCQARGR